VIVSDTGATTIAGSCEIGMSIGSQKKIPLTIFIGSPVIAAVRALVSISTMPRITFSIEEY